MCENIEKARIYTGVMIEEGAISYTYEDKHWSRRHKTHHGEQTITRPELWERSKVCRADGTSCIKNFNSFGSMMSKEVDPLLKELGINITSRSGVIHYTIPVIIYDGDISYQNLKKLAQKKMRDSLYEKHPAFYDKFFGS